MHKQHRFYLLLTDALQIWSLRYGRKLLQLKKDTRIFCEFYSSCNFLLLFCFRRECFIFHGLHCVTLCWRRNWSCGKGQTNLHTHRHTRLHTPTHTDKHRNLHYICGMCLCILTCVYMSTYIHRNRYIPWTAFLDFKCATFLWSVSGILLGRRACSCVSYAVYQWSKWCAQDLLDWNDPQISQCLTHLTHTRPCRINIWLIYSITMNI